MFEDNTGGWSMTRTVLAFITLTVMLTWAVSCYRAKSIQPIPDNAVMLIIGFGGVKAVQRFGEKGADYSVNVDATTVGTPPPQVAPQPVIIYQQPPPPPAPTLPTIPQKIPISLTADGTPVFPPTPQVDNNGAVTIP
jgi:hypothetical protein